MNIMDSGKTSQSGLLAGNRVRIWVQEFNISHMPDFQKQATEKWHHVRYDKFWQNANHRSWLDKNVDYRDYFYVASNFWFTHGDDAVMFKLSFDL